MKRLNWIVSGLVSLGVIVMALLMFSSMGVEEFINLVSEMMNAQADYWKHRTQSNLIKAKGLEKQVRQALADGIAIPVEAVLDNRLDESDQGEQIGLFE